MSHKPGDRGVLFMQNIPKALKDMFKASAARRGHTMSAVVKALMRMYVDNPGCVDVDRWLRSNLGTAGQKMKGL